MNNRQLFIGFAAEGSTDGRFLTQIIKKAVEYIVNYESKGNIDVFDIDILHPKKNNVSFPEYAIEAVKEAIENGKQILILHSDSDKDTYDQRMEHKFIPAKEAMSTNTDEEIREYRDYLVPIIPVRMIEAWMLADKSLFKEQLGTTVSDDVLGLTSLPEEMADPKRKINEAIRIAREHSTHKKQLNVEDISELYEIMGAKLERQNLLRQSSYCKFEDEIRKALRALGYL